MMSAPNDKTLLHLIKKRPMTVAEIRSLYDREYRDGISDIINGLLKAQYVERLPGTYCDGAEYRITSKGVEYIEM